MTCYIDLQTERHFENGPIPISKVKEYAKGTGIDENLVKYFTRVIQIINTAHTDWVASEREKQQKAQSGKTVPNSGDGRSLGSGARSRNR